MYVAPLAATGPTVARLISKTLSMTSEEYALAGVEIEEYENKLLKLTGQLNEVEKAQRKVNKGLSSPAGKLATKVATGGMA